MDGKIERLKEGAMGFWRYVRVGNRYSLGPDNHADQTCELMNVKERDLKVLRGILLATDEEIDMGMLFRREDLIQIGMDSMTLGFPNCTSANYNEIKQRTVDLLKNDFPEEVFEIMSR